MKSTALLLVMLLTMLLFTVISTYAFADRDDRSHHDRDGRQRPPSKDYRVDERYRHDRIYPRQGYIEHHIPDRRYSIHFKNRNYLYFGGIWYNPVGPNFVVVAPPIGIIVPVLPPYYTTLWVHGMPYYYANDVYYVWRPDLNGYEVTNPPPQDSAQEPQWMADQLFIYPQKGQSEQQQADDRYACYRWSVEQTNYDPTEPPTGLAQSVLRDKRENYQRAMKSCLEGRGYSVR